MSQACRVITAVYTVVEIRQLFTLSLSQILLFSSTAFDSSYESANNFISIYL